MRRPRSSSSSNSNDLSCVGRMLPLEVNCCDVLHLNKQELGLFCVEQGHTYLAKSSCEPDSH